MPFDHVAQPWVIRSTLVVVADLDRSVAFYRELGPFEEIVREDAVAVLGDVSPASIVLMLREARSIQARRGQQSLPVALGVLAPRPTSGSTGHTTSPYRRDHTCECRSC